MDKVSKRAIITAVFVVIAVFSFCYILNVNQLSLSKHFITTATYIEEKPYFASSYEGTKGGISLYFKLDSGAIVQFGKTPFTKAVVLGDRVKILYRKGKFFGNPIYDSYEPIKTPFRAWTDSELNVTK
jgi:hypothetical protein